MANLCEKRLFLLDMDGTLYLDETLFDQLFTCVFTSGDIRIYQIHQL